MGKSKTIGVITLADGTKKEVLSRNGKFLVCRDAQYFTWRYPLEPLPKKAKEKDDAEA